MYKELLNQLKKLIVEVEENSNADIHLINEIYELIDRLEGLE
jgi:hypothetical protein